MNIHDWIYLFVVALYWYWMPAALVLLNWTLACRLETRAPLGPIVAINAVVSLLLLAPARAQGGGFVFPGVVYYPWYLEAPGERMDDPAWMALVLLIAGATLVTVMTFYYRKRRVARGADQ